MRVLQACLLGFLGWLVSSVAGMPLQMTISNRMEECVYEKLQKDEIITLRMYVLSGNSLRATLKAAGPVAAPEVETGIELQQAMTKYDRNPLNDAEAIHEKETVDFEDYAIYPDDDAFMDDDAHQEHNPEEETREQRSERRAKEHRRTLEKRQREERIKTQQHHRIREEGDPFISTYEAILPGWYRFCAHATWNEVTVEIELRKSSEFGLDEYGEVMSLEEYTIREEEKLMEKDSAAEEGIKDEDFTSTKDKLKTLRRLLADIQTKQQQERHRLIVHSVTNEHSHSHMVLSSLLETILFMVVTGFQVYTIRRWFKGAPVLGR